MSQQQTFHIRDKLVSLSIDAICQFKTGNDLIRVVNKDRTKASIVSGKNCFSFARDPKYDGLDTHPLSDENRNIAATVWIIYEETREDGFDLDDIMNAYVEVVA